MELFSSKFWQQSRIYLLLIALAPALGGATNFINALYLGLITLVITIAAGLVNVALKGIIDKEARVPFTVIVTLTLLTIYQFYLTIFNASLLDELGIFIPLVALNVLVLRQTVLFEVEDVSKEFRKSVWLGVQFLFILIFLGGLREVFSTGGIMGTELLARDLSFFGEPGGMMIILGMLFALVKAIAPELQQEREKGVK